MRTATNASMRPDLRRQRAEALLHAIMRKLRPHISERSERDAYSELYELLLTEGWEVLSDYHREQWGMPPRGPDGWTADEVVAYEKLRLAAMLRPITVTGRWWRIRGLRQCLNDNTGESLVFSWCCR